MTTRRDAAKARAVMELMNELSASIDAMKQREAEKNGVWMALLFDTETHEVTAHGPFDSPDEARVWADEFDRKVNLGEPIPTPIKATVLPLWPKNK